MSQPKITVVTVCRNVGEELLDTIKSVRAQTYKNIEYIIIDGASTDNTVDIIKQNTSLIDIWISEPDRGIYDAMNKATKVATGEWISFINVGDSYADERVIETVFSNVIPEEVKIIAGNTRNCFADGHVEIHYAESPDVIPFRLPFSHQACFMRRILEGRAPFQFSNKFKLAADYDLIYHIYSKFGSFSILLVDRIIANYKQEGSTSLVNYRQAKKEYLKIQSDHPNKRWLKEVIKYLFCSLFA